MDSQCPLCFDEYDLSVRENLPYNLKCGHVCCHKCLVILKTGSGIPPSKEDEKKFLLCDIKDFKCPMCRMKNPDISPLRFSENIQDFIIKIKKKKIYEANLKGKNIIFEANLKGRSIIEQAEVNAEKIIQAAKDIRDKILAEAESLRFSSLEREIQILKEKQKNQHIKTTNVFQQNIKSINVIQNWEEVSFIPRKKRRISNT